MVRLRPSIVSLLLERAKAIVKINERLVSLRGTYVNYLGVI
jgi:hypothetical protein